MKDRPDNFRSFWIGFFRNFDLTGSVYSSSGKIRENITYQFKSDQEAMKSDWLSVGRDMSEAIHAFERKNKKRLTA